MKRIAVESKIGGDLSQAPLLPLLVAAKHIPIVPCQTCEVNTIPAATLAKQDKLRCHMWEFLSPGLSYMSYTGTQVLRCKGIWRPVSQTHSHPIARANTVKLPVSPTPTSLSIQKSSLDITRISSPAWATYKFRAAQPPSAHQGKKKERKKSAPDPYLLEY